MVNYENRFSNGVLWKTDSLHTKGPIEEGINGRNGNDDSGWYRKESLGLKISPVT